jgi:hypothetical protein
MYQHIWILDIFYQYHLLTIKPNNDKSGASLWDTSDKIW